MCKKFIKKAKQCNVPNQRGKKNMWFKFQGFARPAFMVILLVFVAMYLGVINSRATMGYKISELEDKLTIAHEVNEKLSIQTIELQQVGRVEEIAMFLKMVETGEVDYLSVDKEGLALR